ncbi:lycopene cyclase family protein [Sediminibacterium soli]|uniref:lycopene cyclase family protein n=1 Tax=Sediminibacterium soli TaxID=2698829 RepID=UPI00137A1068|nr:lycopene cyclase family protein [Sediminibacterium soli]NCI45401.1 lycopene cyclase [Sediminibacterium soli]
MQQDYDYIITGAGCAGMSLLMRMLSDPFFGDKKILLIDQSEKKADDHTWCFWEKEDDVFEAVVSSRWEQARFVSTGFSATLDLSPYCYKMIRSADLYRLVQQKQKLFPNSVWLQSAVRSVQTRGEIAVVETEAGRFTAAYVFNSIFFEPPVIGGNTYFLWQHFTGWFIETPEPCFDKKTATLMDFTTDQSAGTSFLYVLPLSARAALVEYTVFSEQLLPPQAYEKGLKQYISNTLGITAYTITHTEQGKIPMTSHRFPACKGRVVNIGTAGGDIKPSTGYGFSSIQRRTKNIVASLKTKGHPFVAGDSKRFFFYDSVLLHVLQRKLLPGNAVFTAIFRHNPPERVLCFLDNSSVIWQDIRLMRSVPQRIFLSAAWQVLTRKT